MIAERIVGTKADLRVPDSNGALFPKAAIRSSKFNDCLVPHSIHTFRSVRRSALGS